MVKLVVILVSMASTVRNINHEVILRRYEPTGDMAQTNHDNWLGGDDLGTRPRISRLSGDITNVLVTHRAAGTLPSELGILSKVTHLNTYLNANAVTGRLPAQVGELAALTSVKLDADSFDGSLPTRLSLLNVAIQNDLLLTGDCLEGATPTQRTSVPACCLPPSLPPVPMALGQVPLLSLLPWRFARRWLSEVMSLAAFGVLNRGCASRCFDNTPPSTSTPAETDPPLHPPSPPRARAGAGPCPSSSCP